MHVGYEAQFQHRDDRPDRTFIRKELEYCCKAEALSFDSVWLTEHHFSDYGLIPDPLQALSYIAARTMHVQLGTAVAVLPWHDPVRLAEQVLLADHLSDGRLVLGIGRGLSEAEFEGLRVPFEESRGRFAEHAELLLQALRTGVIEGGELTRQPRRELRPRPFKPFDGRVFSASASPESAPLIARLGLGTMFIVKRPERLEQDIAPHRAAWSEHHGRDTPLPPPLLSAAVVVDESEDRALEMAQKSDRARRRVSDRHYGVVRAAPVPDLPPVSLIYGTPDQVLKRFEELKSVLGMQGVLTIFPGIPDEDGDRSMDCFARHCLPELKSWPAESTF